MGRRHDARVPLRQQVLILCEGSETEPNYLDALARDRQITGLLIPRNHETDPLNLVKTAIGELKKNKSIAHCFVVIDRDDHRSFDDARGLAQTYAVRDERLKFIDSHPSFELWLYLHERFTRSPCSREEILRELKKLVPQYDKASIEVMDLFITKLDENAIPNAVRALEDAVATGERNSSTKVHEMIAVLLNQV